MSSNWMVLLGVSQRVAKEESLCRQGTRRGPICLPGLPESVRSAPLHPSRRCKALHSDLARIHRTELLAIGRPARQHSNEWGVAQLNSLAAV